MKRGNALRILRQTTLALVALALLGGTWLGRVRTTSWQETLWVTVYPVLAGQLPATADYVAALSAGDFEPMAAFVAAEATRYGQGIDRPIRVDLGNAVSMPPAPPAAGGVLAVMAWSLHLRWWAWRELADQPGPTPDVRLFAVYHDAAGQVLPHSLGLQESRIGVAHLFGSRRARGSNQVVLVHELLHTLGATDKYDAASTLPAFPGGYAEPDRQPRFPQRYAEIMGGRIPLAADAAAIPANLLQVRVGDATAAELRWTR
jgi:hypothetical protein